LKSEVEYNTSKDEWKQSNVLTDEQVKLLILKKLERAIDKKHPSSYSGELELG
jgi:hypothetical protein